MKFKINEKIASIKAYVPGKPLEEVKREYGISNVIKLASNENALGFSPKVHEAVTGQMKNMNRYPESSGFNLTGKLSEKYNIGRENIVLGNGSDDIIALLAHAFLNPGDEALMPLPSFLMYEICVKTAKGVPVMVPLDDYTTNLDGILERISAKTRLVFITNPFNPTGSTVTYDDFYRFLARVPEDVIVVVDEAYIEFVRDETVFNSLKKPLEDPRVVTLRTFSKVYGLAGFRIGYGVMVEEVAEILNRIRQPFNVNSLALAAAEAAFDDTEFLSKSIDLVHDGLDFLAGEIGRLGYECLPSQANFMMVDLKTDATDVFEKMLRQGVIVRAMKSYGYDSFLRITAGTMDENKAVVEALKTVMA